MILLLNIGGKKRGTMRAAGATNDLAIPAKES